MNQTAILYLIDNFLFKFSGYRFLGFNLTSDGNSQSTVILKYKTFKSILVW